MKNMQKLMAFSLLLAMTQIYCSDNQSSQDVEFPQHTTEKYIYNKTIHTTKHNALYTSIFGKHPNGKSVTDATSEDLLSNRVTRKRVETDTENGVSITTTETWVSRNPSYLTWVNGALVIAATAGIVLGATALNSLGDVTSAVANAYGNIGAAGFHAAGNVGAAAVNSAGDLGSTFMNLDDNKKADALRLGFSIAQNEAAGKELANKFYPVSKNELAPKKENVQAQAN